MAPFALIGGVGVAFVAWAIALTGNAFTGHMVAHMALVAVAAPLLALGLAGTRLDPATRWPGHVAPLPMSLVELVVAWVWHAPAARAFAEASLPGFLIEQAMFLAAGLLLWSACLGAPPQDRARRGTGVAALLLTSMHMTLLGALLALTPRPLYGMAIRSCLGIDLPPLVDQQLGGTIMLMIGAVAYLVGGLTLLGGLLRARAGEESR
ncbi:hypothetical protein CLG96_17870 [Sphingomonas oleivorans]|uniref:Cytochrome-c oxidase n=1 Tax=Sphingomonas oleivorans TaxID=1735121 RepID=A0A2T5FTL5_9SPHN|nr:cytochrome c oxidase assembly protein [Sphingomonas oleivorans]PTQ07411.1 hypothetical protein CLG96_17870 [Sphingomonas oleivorans]